MNPNLSELEQAFRQSWRDFAPQRYAEFLAQTREDSRLELLARLLSVELEFAFQPPQSPSASPAATSATTQRQRRTPDSDSDQDDDQRVKPCVPLFLLRFPELAHRTELVMRLIVLEYALRLRHDPQPPNPESYLPLCQQQTDQLIRLLELTENKLPVHRTLPEVIEPISHSDSTVKEASLSSSIALDPLPLNLGCFLLVRLLGRGGMGYVHAAIDLRSTAQVAVKVMRRVDAWSIYRFIEEFRWLSQLSHPNLVKLYDAFCEGEIRYFSMELVEGRTVREWFRKFNGNGEARWRELRRVLGQFASAIDYLHQHHVLHCDIKCSNMMIAAGNRAVLLDLGLAVRAGQDNRLVGTLQYMSPEVISGGVATYASDWYSFGVMIYEVLTDSFPPIQIDLSQGGQQLGQPAGNYRLNLEQLHHNLRECPQDLTELCIDLLQPNPSQRPTGSQVLARLKGGVDKLRAFMVQPECRGRQLEMSAMNQAVVTAQQGRATVVVLEGDSGSGKSTLLQSWAKSWQPQQGLLLSVRCYRQDHTPVRLLNALVQELAAAVPQLPEQNWKPALLKQVAQMGVLFPQVQQLLPAPLTVPKKAIASATSNDVAISSFVRWLLDLTQHQRLIICVDDAQWADHESLRTLKRWLSQRRRFASVLVLVDESGRQQLRELFQAEEPQPRGPAPAFELIHLPVGPLSEETCHELIQTWAAAADVPINASVASDIVERSSCNPFLLQEIFRTFVHHTLSGDISGSDWLIADSQSSVRRRFSMLPQPAENILQFLAVADQAMSFHQLQMVSRILPHELQRTLSLLASQGWIRSRSGELESDVEIAHENFRRAIYQSIPVDRLHRRHYRLARILSCETPPVWARVANHYWSAKYFREASLCYLEAARTAMNSGGHSEAIDFLSRANHPQAQRTRDEQLRVMRMKAECLARVGSSRAAAELYDELLQEELQADSPDDAPVTIFRCLAGEQRIRAGQLEAGLARLELALQELGITLRKKNSYSQLRLALQVLRLAFRTPRLTEATAIDDSLSRPFTEMERCLNRISPSLTFLDSQLGPDVVLGMARLADQRGTEFDRALALLRSGVLLSFGGRRLRLQALRRLRIGRGLARASRAEEARATTHFCMFVWYLQRGRIASAARVGRAGLSLYRACRADTQWEQQFLQWAMLSTAWYGNKLRELQQSTSSLRQSAHDRSDPMSLFWMHVESAHSSDLVGDRADQARASLEIASAAITTYSFQSPHFFLWLSRVQQALYENDAAQALEILRQDWNRLHWTLIMRTNHYRWMALCTRLCCDLVGLRELPPRLRARLLRDARRSVRRMRRLEEPVFRLYADAYSLVIEANYGQTRKKRTAPAGAWESTMAKLHRHGHHLLAVALKWQYSFHAPEDQRQLLANQAQTALEQEDCVAPQRLLDIILPLPPHQSIVNPPQKNPR